MEIYRAINSDVIWGRQKHLGLKGAMERQSIIESNRDERYTIGFSDRGLVIADWGSWGDRGIKLSPRRNKQEIVKNG